MKVTKILATIVLSLIALVAQAQAEAKMKTLQARGFGAKNREAQTVTDSAAVSQQPQEAKEGETDPSFPGGPAFLQAYLRKKLLHNGVNGKGEVVIGFNVDAKGNIYGAKVTKSGGSTFDTAAFNIVTGMPRWRPGTTNGVPVDKPAEVTVRFGEE